MISVSPFSIPTLTHPADAQPTLTVTSTSDDANNENIANAAGEEKVKPGQESANTSGDANANVAAPSPKNDDPSKPRVWKPLDYMSPWIFIPKYLEVDFATCSAVFLRSPLVQPSLMEIPSPFPPSWHQLVFEW
jgi:hypothetical protein